MNLRYPPETERLLFGLEGVTSQVAAWTAEEKESLIRTDCFMEQTLSLDGECT